MSTMNVQADPGYLAMPDAVNVNLLPAGYPAYLGYADGLWPTGVQLDRMFPEAHLIVLTVTAQTTMADGCDVEPGNINVATARVWVQRKLAAAPDFRPVVYASVIGQPNFGMGDMIASLTRNSIALDRVRLLSAHYGLDPHICGPATCKAISVPMDGTQWTDSYPVPGGVVDMSLLKPGFFGPVPVLPLTERLMQELGTVRQGDTGEAVRTVQGLCLARGFVISRSTSIDGLDGDFGPMTETAVRRIQAAENLIPDGVVGPLTWPVLLGVA